MTEIVCLRCGRSAHIEERLHGPTWQGVYSYAVHDYYGCDTGCCGHMAYLCNGSDQVIDEHFEFTHPYGETPDAWAREFCLSFWPDVPVKIEMCQVSED